MLPTPSSHAQHRYADISYVMPASLSALYEDMAEQSAANNQNFRPSTASVVATHSVTQLERGSRARA